MNRTDVQLILLRGQRHDPFASVRQIGMAGVRLRPQSPTLLSDGVICSLLRSIAQGRLQPGAKIPSEISLAAAAGVSRVTIRVALDWLKQNGMLVSRRGEPTRVIARDAPEGHVIEALADDYRMTMQELGEVMELLLVHAISQIHRRAGDGRTVAHQEICGEYNAAAEIDFLFAIAVSSGSVLCEHMLESLHRPIQDFCASALSAARMNGNAHRIEVTARQTLGAIAAGDLELAIETLSAHMQLLKGNTLFGGLAVFQDGDELLDLLTEVSKSRTTDLVVDSLRSMLGSCNAETGLRLPGERTLADQLGVSRASIRAAQHRLKQQGYLETSQRSGTRIKGTVDGTASLHERARSLYRTFSDMCEIRSLIEPWAVRRAASVAKESDIKMLRGILVETSRSSRSERLKSTDDMRFHKSVAVASGSAIHLFLAEVNHDILYDYFDFSLFKLQTAQGMDRDVQHHHAEIVRHIEYGESDEAAHWQTEHSRVFQVAYRSGASEATGS